MKKTLQTQKEMSMSRAAVIGIAICIVISLLAGAGLTSMVLGETISEANMHYYTFGVLFIACFLGVLIAAKLAGGKYAVVAGIVAGVYLLLLLAVAILLFDGMFSGVIGKGVSILLGAGAACAICIRKGNGKKGRKRAFR